jgi:hypothetical protein
MLISIIELILTKKMSAPFQIFPKHLNPQNDSRYFVISPFFNRKPATVNRERLPLLLLLSLLGFQYFLSPLSAYENP